MTAAWRRYRGGIVGSNPAGPRRACGVAATHGPETSSVASSGWIRDWPGGRGHRAQFTLIGSALAGGSGRAGVRDAGSPQTVTRRQRPVEADCEPDSESGGTAARHGLPAESRSPSGRPQAEPPLTVSQRSTGKPAAVSPAPPSRSLKLTAVTVTVGPGAIESVTVIIVMIVRWRLGAPRP